MNTPTLDSAIAASHKAQAAILKGDQSGYLEQFSTAEDVTLGNPFGPFGRGRKNVDTGGTPAVVIRDGSALVMRLGGSTPTAGSISAISDYQWF